MERYKDEEGKWAWRLEKKVVTPSEKKEEAVVVKDKKPIVKKK